MPPPAPWKMPATQSTTLIHDSLLPLLSAAPQRA
jgi:hypothetical protein